MADAFKYDVFLSHSAKDKAVVRIFSLSPFEAEREKMRTTALSFALWLRKTSYLKASAIGAWHWFYANGSSSSTNFHQRRIRQPPHEKWMGGKPCTQKRRDGEVSALKEKSEPVKRPVCGCAGNEFLVHRTREQGARPRNRSKARGRALVSAGHRCSLPRHWGRQNLRRS